jgi:hypothetical protein
LQGPPVRDVPLGVGIRTFWVIFERLIGRNVFSKETGKVSKGLTEAIEMCGERDLTGVPIRVKHARSDRLRSDLIQGFSRTRYPSRREGI